MKANIILVDDHAAFRRSLRDFLADYPRFEIIGEAANGNELFGLPSLKKCDLILLDIAMPGMDGIEALRQLPRAFPEAKAVMVSGRSEAAYVDAARRYGAAGFIPKDEVFLHLIPGLTKVLAGESYFLDRA